MEKQEIIQCLESLLFASGRAVDKKMLAEIMGVKKEDVVNAANELKDILIERNSGIQLIEINEGYQLATIEKFYPQVCTLLDNRPKPSLSQAAMEVLAIVAYNPKITRAELERIRGVSSDSAMNKLLEYNLIEEAGRLDAPGRPTMYKTTDEFLRLFGYKSLSDMPELPKLKEDDGQIELDEMNEEATKDENTNEDTKTTEEINTAVALEDDSDT
ncbi:MAG: SMC-Scp complex subunit ScpB [Clostridia bacterium]|nr:SMC-Scp complex subunit ScpB [Clostridia bacterium]